MEDLEQLYRRIGCYVYVSEDIVRVYDDGVNEFGHPKGPATIIPNELVKKIKSERQRPDISSVFKKIEENGV